MPDTFSISLSLIGLYYGLEYLVKNGKFYSLIFFFFFSLAGILSKIPALTIFSVFLLPFINKAIPLSRKIVISLLFITIGLITAWWYFLWVPFLVKEYHFWHYFMGTNIINGAKELAWGWNETLNNFYFGALKYSGFALFIAGTYLAFKNREKIITSAFIVSGIFFFIFMLKAGRVFYHHSYYIVPFVPFMALNVGYLLSRIKKKFLLGLILFIFITESIADQQHDFRIKQAEYRRLGLENILDSISHTSDLIAVNGSYNPRDVYYCHRKGWTLNYWQLNTDSLDSIHQKGCKLLIIDKNYSENQPPLQLPYDTMFSDTNYVILNLNSPDK